MAKSSNSFSEKLFALRLEVDSIQNDSNLKTNRRKLHEIREVCFKDYLLKPELLHGIMDCGLEHPTEGQHELIPQAIRGKDILYEAKSGMGKTAAFVLVTLQQIQPVDGQVSTIVLCHTRTLALQISREYECFSKYMENVKVSVFSGLSMKSDEDILKTNCPHIVIGTPDRILALVKSKALSLHHVKHLILDECRVVLESLDMRRDIQEIFQMTPHEKQVLMFSATLNEEIRSVCKTFMKEPMEIYMGNEKKLSLYGLRQHYVKLRENQKDRILIDLLDKLEFIQVVIFVKSVPRCIDLCKLLNQRNSSAIGMHHQMPQEELLTHYKKFEESERRILITTMSFKHGIDIKRVNIVFNYDMPKDSNTYLHRVARAGLSITKGLAITYVTDESDMAILKEVEKRFDVQITDMPYMIDPATYVETR